VSDIREDEEEDGARASVASGAAHIIVDAGLV
jgi:hypothetical protein